MRTCPKLADGPNGLIEHRLPQSYQVGTKLSSTRAQCRAAIQQERHRAYSLEPMHQRFIDDGQAFVSPHLADSWLRAVDAALLDIEAARGEGSGVKSLARLLCPVDARQQVDGWDTAYILDTCQVDGAFDPVEILGANIGNNSQINDHVAQLISKTLELHGKVNSIDHAATEMVFYTTMCQREQARVCYAHPRR